MAYSLMYFEINSELYVMSLYVTFWKYKYIIIIIIIIIIIFIIIIMN